MVMVAVECYVNSVQFAEGGGAAQDEIWLSYESLCSLWFDGDLEFCRSGHTKMIWLNRWRDSRW